MLAAAIADGANINLMSEKYALPPGWAANTISGDPSDWISKVYDKAGNIIGDRADTFKLNLEVTGTLSQIMAMLQSLPQEVTAQLKAGGYRHGCGAAGGGAGGLQFGWSLHRVETETGEPL
jgi:hypothetical protein